MTANLDAVSNSGRSRRAVPATVRGNRINLGVLRKIEIDELLDLGGVIDLMGVQRRLEIVQPIRIRFIAQDEADAVGLQLVVTSTAIARTVERQPSGDISAPLMCRCRPAGNSTRSSSRSRVGR